MMYIINTVDDYQYDYINYMEYDILSNQTTDKDKLIL